VLWQHKPPPAETDAGFESEFADYSDTDARRIALKMWIHHLVGISHFTVVKICWWLREIMLTNLLKSPFPQRWGKWKRGPESVSGTVSVLPTGRSDHNTKLQGSRLIAFATMLHRAWQINWSGRINSALG